MAVITIIICRSGLCFKAAWVFLRRRLVVVPHMHRRVSLLASRRPFRRACSTLLKASEADAALKRPRMEELVLVRHGESEGNLAYNRSVAGDHSLYSDEFLERHSSFWRLTDQGREQALVTGEWMRSNMDVRYNSFFSSEYLRALETAALLKLPNARWKPEVMLRERDWGEYDLASQLERRVAFRRYEARRRRESLFWAPPGGESLAQVVQRVDSVLLFGNRRWSGGRVIMTCHGELMWAFRLRFERLTQLRYREMQANPKTSDRIHNCQILQYTRRCPETGALHPDFKFMRSICPWNLSLSDGCAWRELSPSGGLTNDEVMASVARYPRLLNDEDGDDAFSDSLPLPGFLGDPEQGLSCAGDVAPSMLGSDAVPAAEGSLPTERGHARDVVQDGERGSGVGPSSSPSSSSPSSSSPSSSSPSSSSPSERVKLERPLRVLLLTKTARWRLLDEDEDEERRDALQWACATHEAAVRSVVQSMRAAQFEMRSQDARKPVPPSHLEWADICVALGGDGTILRAAQVAPTGMLCVGVNTDPQRSVGKICAWRISPDDPAADAETLVGRLRSGSYEEMRMPRLRVTVDGGRPPRTVAAAAARAAAAGGAGGAPSCNSEEAAASLSSSLEPPALPWELSWKGGSVRWALNECFVGEVDPARPLDLEISVDDGPWRPWRSSGVLVATQLGSGAWLRNACAVSHEQVSAVLKTASSQGLITERKNFGETWSHMQLASMANAASSSLLRHEDAKEVQYLVREPSLRAPLRPIGQTGLQLAEAALATPHGIGRKVRVRPSGWQPVASIDGLQSMALPWKCVLTLEVEPDRAKWLRTVKE